MITTSAIVSTYKSERFIRGCLEDLVSQSLFQKGALEIVVVISGSPENEEQIVKEFYKRFPSQIVYIVTERESMYTAWNRGIKQARGEYITNANTDDRHRSDALEVLTVALDKNSKIDLVYGNCLVTGEENAPYPHDTTKYRVYIQPQFFAPNAALHYQFGPQPMWRKKIHEQLGFFSESLKAAGDYDFNLRFALKHRALRVTKEPIGSYLAHQSAISFKDDVIGRESEMLYATYRTKEQVIEFYKNEGLDANNSDERAVLFTDFAIRALEYYPPWFAGGGHRDVALAKRYLEYATADSPNYVAATFNLAIIHLFTGETASALAISERLNQCGANELSQTIIQSAKEKSQNLSMCATGLKLPSQRELSF